MNDDMNAAARLLIVWHSRTGYARQMAEAMRDGAQWAAEGLEMTQALELSMLPAEDASAEALLAADGCLFCAPENLAALSGAMKEFFDRCYYPALGRIEGRPYGLAIAAGTDGAGAARQAERICTGERRT